MAISKLKLPPPARDLTPEEEEINRQAVLEYMAEAGLTEEDLKAGKEAIEEGDWMDYIAPFQGLTTRPIKYAAETAKNKLAKSLMDELKAKVKGTGASPGQDVKAAAEASAPVMDYSKMKPEAKAEGPVFRAEKLKREEAPSLDYGNIQTAEGRPKYHQMKKTEATTGFKPREGIKVIDTDENGLLKILTKKKNLVDEV